MQAFYDVLGQEVPEEGQGGWGPDATVQGYVDDSNQVGRVPSEGSKYNADTKKVDVYDNEAELRRGEEPDTRLAWVLKDIANYVQSGRELEEDHPSKNQDGMMPIQDMKVKITENGVIVYKHFEKEVS